MQKYRIFISGRDSGVSFEVIGWCFLIASWVPCRNLGVLHAYYINVLEAHSKNLIKTRSFADLHSNSSSLEKLGLWRVSGTKELDWYLDKE